MNVVDAEYESNSSDCESAGNENSHHDHDADPIDDSHQFIEVPHNRAKLDLIVLHVSDLEHLLATLDYWMSDELPGVVVEFCLTTTAIQVDVSPTAAKISTVSCLNRVFGIGGFSGPRGARTTGSTSSGQSDCVEIASDQARSDTLELLGRFVRGLPQFQPVLTVAKAATRVERVCAAASSGNITILRFVLAHALMDDQATITSDICAAAAHSGAISCLEVLRENSYPWDATVCAAAAKAGQLECLKYLHEQGCPWNDTVSAAAAEGGSLPCLKYLLDHGCECDSDWVAAQAAKHGHLDCLIHTVREGYVYLTTYAAQGGNVECLRYLNEQVPGCSMSELVTAAAAAKGSLECLIYAHTQGIPIHSLSCIEAASKGHVECLVYAHEHGPAEGWNSRVCTAAASNGKIECLVYAHEHGCPWDEDTCCWAARYGYLECLKYAHDHGCPWNVETCQAAAVLGHLECLKYAHEHGCPWDASTCQTAARAGQFECLKYAHENGCPRDNVL